MRRELRLAVLFWFYKDLTTCRDRVRTLRCFNPGVEVYGLYGGDVSGAKDAEAAMADLFDDFWAFPEANTPRWKWTNGDLMIARWFSDRGSSLKWDTIFVVQWDMLVAAPLSQLFPALQEDQILLSGFRPIDEVKTVWWWAKRTDHQVARELDDFQEFLSTTCHYDGPIFACLFVVACLPRQFLERFVALGPPTVGFMEYKLPTLAKVLQVEVCEAHSYRPGGWSPKAGVLGLSSSERFLNAINIEPPLSSILKEFRHDNGHRVFHPVRISLKPWMLNPIHARWLWPLVRVWEILREVKASLGRKYRKLHGAT